MPEIVREQWYDIHRRRVVDVFIHPSFYIPARCIACKAPAPYLYPPQPRIGPDGYARCTSPFHIEVVKTMTDIDPWDDLAQHLGRITGASPQEIRGWIGLGKERDWTPETTARQACNFIAIGISAQWVSAALSVDPLILAAMKGIDSLTPRQRAARMAGLRVGRAIRRAVERVLFRLFGDR